MVNINYVSSPKFVQSRKVFLMSAACLSKFYKFLKLSFYAPTCKTNCLQILYLQKLNFLTNIVHQLTLSLRCKYCKINVKKLQFIHMLTATDLRTSKTAKIKKLYYYITAHRHTSMCSSIVK